MNTIEIEDSLGITFCKRQSIAVERGEGCLVWDEEGREYLDFTSGWGVTCLGHAHPIITEAIVTQAQKIIQNPNSGFTYSPPRARLLQTLSAVLPISPAKLYFASSGAEANDAAVKLARKITGKSRIVSTLGSFHGRTFNTLSISGGSENAAQFLPALRENAFVPFGDFEALVNAVDGRTAAVIIEPIQGEGGVRIPDHSYLSRVAEYCRRVGVLLIVDEIQTGFCRTGKFFAIEHDERAFSPDILTMGKGIAGGLSFAAFAVSESVNSRLRLGDHGGTFSGNPLACAVAASVVDFLRNEDMASRVEALGRVLLSGLDRLQAKYPELISAVRGRGLLCAFDLQSDEQVAQLTAAALQRGMIVTPTRNRTVRLIPPLIVNVEQLKQGLDALDGALALVVPSE